MPMPCALHPKATIDPEHGCLGCWFISQEVRESGTPALTERRICEGCAMAFTIKNPKQRFCSDACRSEKYRTTHDRKAYFAAYLLLRDQKVTRYCRACGKAFEVRASNNWKKNCSRQCTDSALHRRTYRSRAKLSKSERTVNARRRSSQVGANHGRWLQCKCKCHNLENKKFTTRVAEKTLEIREAGV